MRAWMRGLAGQRTSEQASGSGLRVLLVLLLYYREGQKTLSSGVGFRSGLGLNQIWIWTYVRMYSTVLAVVREGQLRLSADVDGTSMTKDPRMRRGCSW